MLCEAVVGRAASPLVWTWPWIWLPWKGCSAGNSRSNWDTILAHSGEENVKLPLAIWNAAKLSSTALGSGSVSQLRHELLGWAVLGLRRPRSQSVQLGRIDTLDYHHWFLARPLTGAYELINLTYYRLLGGLKWLTTRSIPWPAGKFRSLRIELMEWICPSLPHSSHRGRELCFFFQWVYHPSW